MRPALRCWRGMYKHDGDAAARGVINAAAARAELRPELEATGTFALRSHAAGSDGALGELIAIALDAMADGTWERLKVCDNDGCVWAFYDHSRNRSGRWCSMAVCGNRMKVKAYRERSTSQ